MRLKASNEGETIKDVGFKSQCDMEDGGIRKKQIFQGIMKKFTLFKLDLLIIADSWPSVVVGLETNTSSRLWIYSRNMPSTLRRIIPQHAVWLKEVEVANLVKGDRMDAVIIQGTGSFIDEVLGSFCQTIPTHKLHVVLPAKRLRSLKQVQTKISKWYKIGHNKIGGVSNSKWLIGIGHQRDRKEYPSLDELCVTVGLSRHFGDVLKTATRGHVCESPMKPMPSLVALESLGTDDEWQVPCVMSRSGWVTRALIPQEIGAIFDFPELYMSKLTSTKSDVTPTEFKLLFNHNTIPMKIVSVLRGILCYDKDNESTQVSFSETTLARQSKSHETNFNSGLLQDPLSGEIAVDKVEDLATKYLEKFGEKAARSDDAAVPVELWNGVLFEKYFSHIAYSPLKHGRALEVIRNKFALRIYTKNVVSSFFKYVKKVHGNDWLTFYLDTRKQVKGRTKKRKRGWTKRIERYQRLRVNLSIGMEGLTRVIRGSWWEWNFGSTLFFWRWPMQIREAARDGYPVFVQSELPRYRRKQRPPDKEYMLIKMKEKLRKVTDRKYISKDVVLSLINCFAVEKGSDDIRLVYDGTKSKLNAAVFAPNFYLPFLDSVLMWVNVDSWLADLDLGEMFLNYFLDKKIRAFSGVDLSKFIDKCEKNRSDWERWARTFMGFTSSPYICCKFFGWTVDIIYGDRWDQANPYRWDSIRVNFPGSPSYDPTQPRLCKMLGKLIAAMLEVFVDDIRTVGSSMIRCRDATRRASQLLQYLGQQDASRKYRPPHTTPGPWCGSFIAIRNRCVWVYVSKEKWNKAKVFIMELDSIIRKGALEKIPFKFLERGRGFMVYFCRTYTSFVPYLKGIHLTLDSWRSNRDKEGWKMGKKNNVDEDLGNEVDAEDLPDKECPEPLALADVIATRGITSNDEHPDEVFAVPRLEKDISALTRLLERETPPWRFIRGDKVATAQYGFGDAAKSGFGATFEDKNGNIWFRLGVWGDDTSELSSNWRELANLVEALEARASDENFRGIEFFLFTDNSTAEAAFYKGASSSKLLFDLILRLKELELAIGCLFHVIHVSGNRMIAQGTDGTSRGDLGEGVMKGETMLSFVPLHLTAIERCSKLKEQIRKTIVPGKGEEEIIFLDYEEWWCWVREKGGVLRSRNNIES